MSYPVPNVFSRLTRLFVAAWQAGDEQDDIQQTVSDNDPQYAPEVILGPEETLCVAIESLYLFAELAEIHFVKHEQVQLQKRAMKSARHLAKMYTAQIEKPQMNYVLEVEFESFARDLMSLKQSQLSTASGRSWCDIMRKPARTAAEAIQAYQKYYHSSATQESRAA